jgi:ABC-type Na+ efflux pump permease subunit
MVIFLAMGSVASERADRTWEFLVAQPVSRAEIVMVKWKIGAFQLLGMMMIATVAGMLAMWSREAPHTDSFSDRVQSLLFDADVSPYAFMKTLTSETPEVWLCWQGFCSAGALLCWYTPLFLVLTRARNEFSAALGGILLTIVAHAWLAQGITSDWTSALPNPLVPLVMSMHPSKATAAPQVLLVLALLWVCVPLVVTRVVLRRAAIA